MTGPLGRSNGWPRSALQTVYVVQQSRPDHIVKALSAGFRLLLRGLGPRLGTLTSSVVSFTFFERCTSVSEVRRRNR